MSYSCNFLYESSSDSDDSPPSPIGSDGGNNAAQIPSASSNVAALTFDGGQVPPGGFKSTIHEAWESELEGLVEDGLISKDLIDNISRGDSWFDGWEYHNKLQDHARTRPLTAREIELREYQQGNASYGNNAAKDDTVWLRNRKKLVYENFVAIHSFEYEQWKKSQMIEQGSELLQAPEQNAQGDSSNESKHKSDSSSPESSPPASISSPSEPSWEQNTKEQSVPEVPIPEVPEETQNQPAIVVTESITIIYDVLRDKGYSFEAINRAIDYARKGPKDWDIPSVEACEAWINAGMIIPTGPDDWMFGEKTVPQEPSSPPMSSRPPARDYGLRGGPLLYEDFEDVWAEEAAEKAKIEEQKRAEEAKRAEEVRKAEEAKKAEIVAKPARRPISFEYKKLPDNGPPTVYRPTHLMKRSVEDLDSEYQDLTDIERSRGKTRALPQLETLKILALRECRTMNDPKIVDAYIEKLREEYEKIRMSKNPPSLEIQPGKIQDAENSSQGPCGALTKALVTGVVSAAVLVGVKLLLEDEV
ncbi:hypothetical protein BZA77DRAFT_356669 [Pyronema omphalodes]|nr:hypothetical protein BZA77DRAFT_356669 [Pyronema omphalodes]